MMPKIPLVSLRPIAPIDTLVRHCCLNLTRTKTGIVYSKSRSNPSMGEYESQSSIASAYEADDLDKGDIGRGDPSLAVRCIRNR
jgi:hypothetical protein